MGNLPGLFSKTNLLFLEILIDEQLSIRELAEKIKCSPAKASMAVKQFLKNGIVKVKNEKNRKIVILDTGNPLTKQIVSLLFINKIVSSRAFHEMKKYARGIGVYGSVADGTVDARSDIDLWMLTEKRLTIMELAGLRSGLSKEIGKEVSIKAFTKESLEELRQKDKIFFSELEYKSKILHGEAIG